MKKLRVTVDGKVFDVVVESLDEQGRPSSTPPGFPVFQQTSIAPPASSAPKPAAVASGPGSIPSPLAGRIVSVDCKVGDAVKAGAQLATVEAMKMNTLVPADRDGTVTEIHVKPGDAVEEGQALVTLA